MAQGYDSEPTSRGGRDGRTCRVESFGDIVQSVIEEVAVEVEGHGRRCVSEHLLHDLHIGAGSNRERRCCVPQVVRVEIWHADRFGSATEGALERRGPDRFTAADARKDAARFGFRLDLGIVRTATGLLSDSMSSGRSVEAWGLRPSGEENVYRC